MSQAFNLRMPDELKESITCLAKKNGQSINQNLVYILIKTVTWQRTKDDLSALTKSVDSGKWCQVLDNVPDRDHV